MLVRLSATLSRTVLALGNAAFIALPACGGAESIGTSYFAPSSLSSLLASSHVRVVGRMGFAFPGEYGRLVWVTHDREGRDIFVRTRPQRVPFLPERVLLVSRFCYENVVSKGDLLPTVFWQHLQLPVYVYSTGHVVPDALLPDSIGPRAPPSTVLVDGERVLMFGAGCPSRGRCNPDACPNYIHWKLPISDDNFLDLSLFDGPSRISVDAAVDEALTGVGQPDTVVRLR